MDGHDVMEKIAPPKGRLPHVCKMASVQRDHWSYIVLQCLLLSLLLCRNGVFADRNKYYHMSTLCARERHLPLHKKIDGAVVTSEGEENFECTVTFRTDSVSQKFMLRFDHLALDCQDHLYIFEGSHALANHKADLSCRSTRSEVGIIFTHGNFVTLRYVTDNWTYPGNGFKLIITAYKELPVACKGFFCLNDHCISNDLSCDGINHCGDNSDETSRALCVDDSAVSHIMGLGVSVFVAIVVSIFIVCSMCVVGIAICLCRRERHQQDLQSQSQITPSHPLTAGHPPYPTGEHRYTTSTERIGEKPPPYPGNTYAPGTGISYNVPNESLYYPTK